MEGYEGQVQQKEKSVKKQINKKKRKMEKKIGKPSSVKLVYENEIPVSQRTEIKEVKDAYRILLQCYDMQTIEHHMEIKALLVNRAMQVLGVVQISSGGLSTSPADIKCILQAALLSNAQSVILSRNAPSGSVEASREDKFFVEHCKKACKLIDILFMDFIIVTKEQYHSFLDENQL